MANTKEKNVTIRDIAEKCDVSIGTVSGVINDRDHIRPAVRQKVLDAIKALNYNPVKSDRGVAGALRKSVGLVLPTDNTLDSFYSRAVIAAKRSLLENNLNFLLYTEAEIDRITQDEIYPGKQNLHCDGLIFFTSREGCERYIRTVTEWGIRAVAVNTRVDIPGVPNIKDHKGHSARLLMDHLWEMGHKKIGMVSWFRGTSTLLGNTFDEFCREKGLPQRPDWECSHRREKDFRFKHWINRLFGNGTPHPTAVVCDSDQAAVCTVQYLSEIGKKVPADVAVTGINNDDITRLVMPGITTVNVPVQEMIAQAAGLLAGSLENDTKLTKKEYVLDNRLVVRGSTDPEIAALPWNWMGWSGSE